MARWGRRGIAHWLGALLPGRRGVMRIRRRRGWRRRLRRPVCPGGDLPPACVRPRGGRFVSGAGPHRGFGRHFVAAAGTACSPVRRGANGITRRRMRMRVSSRPPAGKGGSSAGMRLFLIVFLSFSCS